MDAINYTNRLYLYDNLFIDYRLDSYTRAEPLTFNSEGWPAEFIFSWVCNEPDILEMYSESDLLEIIQIDFEESFNYM